ncbi:Systemic RNA interference defective protein [Dirofilaria immitis]
MIFLFVLYFAALVSDGELNPSRQMSDGEIDSLHDEIHIQNFPFSLRRSISINGTARKNQINIYYANFEKSNVLDLMRIHVRLHGVSKSLGISKPLLQITCQHPTNAISFALPTEGDDMQNGLLLPSLNKESVEPSSGNKSANLFILVTANSDSILTYSIFVKLYDRAQYNVILRAPEFTRALLNQKISAVLPIAFRVNVSDAYVRKLKITVESDDDFCAFMVVRNYSIGFLHSMMLALNSSIRITFTRKASITILANSPVDIFVMMLKDDLICNPFASAREYSRKKKFDIKFSSLESTSLYPLLIMSTLYSTLAVIFLASGQFMPLHDSQRKTDIPLIVLSNENNSETFPTSMHQEIVPMNDSYSILMHIQMDEDKQQSVKDATLLRTSEQRSISNNTDEIVQVFELSLNAFMPYLALLPVIFQYFYTLLLDQLALMNDHLDACYYNVECSFGLGPFQTFNHMYSNAGYFLLGFAFIVLISRRFLKYWKYRGCAGYVFCAHIFLNIGLMMCLESFASAFYHICPNPRTFHIDTLFVEVALVLLMVRFYFVRRGGISLTGMFQSIIFAISFHFAGNALKNNFYSLSIMLTSELLLLIAFQCHLLLGSQLSVESIRTKNWREWLEYCWQLLARNERDRNFVLKKILLVCITTCNIALALLFETGLLRTSYITLHVIILNTAGYFIYYVFCKIIAGETILIHSFIYTVVSCLLWIVASYFFSHGKNDWTLTAAQNRALSEECIVFGYYDHHDMWHFISSLASFFSLLAIAVLDDDIMISDVDQQPIPIF